MIKFRRWAELKLEGRAPERLINALTARGRQAWNFYKTAPDCANARVFARELPALFADARRMNISVTVVKRRGLMELLVPLKRRPGLIAGGALALALLYIMSGFVWSVRIVPGGGDDREIIGRLREYGLRPGVLKSAIDEGWLKEKLCLEMGELAWVGFFTNGTVVTVTYELATPPPEVIPENQPCSVYGAKRGILTKLNVFNGTAAASVGQTVEAGDLLVSSVMPIGETGKVFYAHAYAEVEARTWYDLSACSASEAVFKDYTGAKMEIYWLIVGKKRIKLSQGSRISYEFYDKITEKAAGGGALPVTIVKETYIEYVPVYGTLDAFEESARLSAELEKLLRLSLVKGSVTALQNAEIGSEGCYSARIVAECREDISVTVAD